MIPGLWVYKVCRRALISDSTQIFGSDLNRETAVEGNTVQLRVNCDTKEELNIFFHKLAEGAEITEPLADRPRGAKYAALTDKYVEKWLLNYVRSGCYGL